MARCAVAGWPSNALRAATRGTRAASTQCPNRRNPTTTMDNPRFFLYAAFALVLFLIWQAWEKDYSARPVAQPVTAGDTQLPQRVDDLPDLPATPVEARVERAGPTGAQIVRSDQRVRVETDVLRHRDRHRGRRSCALLLLDYPLEKDDPNTPFPLLSDDAADVLHRAGRFAQTTTTRANASCRPGAPSAATYELRDGMDELRYR
jgi:YidC/Oxa1 family membrane protein insertase